MPGIVYLLCAVTSFVCFYLLLRGYWRSGVRLLLWSSLCFAGLTVDNLMLYLDLHVIPDVDLRVARLVPGMVGNLLLVFGLVWESK